MQGYAPPPKTDRAGDFAPLSSQRDGPPPPQSARGAGGKAIASIGGGNDGVGEVPVSARAPRRGEWWREGAQVEVSIMGRHGHFGGLEAAQEERLRFTYTAAEATEVSRCSAKAIRRSAVHGPP